MKAEAVQLCFIVILVIGIAMLLTNIVMSLDIENIINFVFKNRWLISIIMIFVSLMAIIYIKYNY